MLNVLLEYCNIMLYCHKGWLTEDIKCLELRFQIWQSGRYLKKLIYLLNSFQLTTILLFMRYECRTVLKSVIIMLKACDGRLKVLAGDMLSLQRYVLVCFTSNH